MRDVSLRHKLALLVGIPVLGAVILSALIILKFQQEAEKTRALGSIENVAQLSRLMTGVLKELQSERALAATVEGFRKPNDGQVKSGQGASLIERLGVQREQTDAARLRLEVFLSSRDLEGLPERLSGNLALARTGLDSLDTFREHLDREGAPLADVLKHFGGPPQSLIAATAGLTELSDDGELLRLITSLVSSLEVAERGSGQHALVGYVYALGSFPPGSYRSLVRLVSEERTHAEALRTTLTTQDLSAVERFASTDVAKAAHEMRRVVLEELEEEVEPRSVEWLDVQGRKIQQFSAFARDLNERVKNVALAKRRASQRAVWGSSALALAVVIGSILMSWLIGRGVTRNVGILQQAAKRVGVGQLGVRVEVTSGDELGTLGRAFNDMMTQLASAKAALSEQVRMASELEIAASIQSSLLPPNPEHPEFEFAGVMLPADEVGGDFYDVLTDAEHRALWLTIGDVSSHGLSAGLVMLMAQASFASQFQSGPAAPMDHVFASVNRVIRENVVERLKDNKYITAQVLCYQGDGRFSCAGGHEWPVLYRNAEQSTEVIEAAGPWLGIVDDLDDIPVGEIILSHGDIMCLYSDGITEARDRKGELFDVDRLERALREAAASEGSLDAIAEHIVQQVRAFCHLQDDDWTMLLVRRRSVKS